MNDNPTGRDLAYDLERLVALEVALRNLAAPWSSAFEVTSRLGAGAPFMHEARPLAYLMRQCTPTTLIAAVSALRAALEEGRS